MGLNFITLKTYREGYLRKIKQHLIKELLSSRLKKDT